MPSWASWSSSPLPGREMALPGMSAVWDRYRDIGDSELQECTSQRLHCAEASPAPAAVPWIVALNGSHSIPGTRESVLEW